MGGGAFEGSSCEPRHMSQQAYPTRQELELKYLEDLKLCFRVLSDRLVRVKGRPVAKKLEESRRLVSGAILFLSVEEARVGSLFVSPEKMEGLGREIEQKLRECLPPRVKSGTLTSEQVPSAVTGTLTPMAAPLGVSQGAPCSQGATWEGSTRGDGNLSLGTRGVPLYPGGESDSTGSAGSPTQGAQAQHQQPAPAQPAGTASYPGIREVGNHMFSLLKLDPDAVTDLESLLAAVPTLPGVAEAPQHG